MWTHDNASRHIERVHKKSGKGTHIHTVGTGLEFEHTSYWYKVVTPAMLRHYGIRVHGCKLAIAQN